MNDDTIVDAEIVPQRAADDTVIQVHLRELPRDDEPAHLAIGDWWAARRAAVKEELEELREQIAADTVFERLQEKENQKARPFDWIDWLQSLSKAQGRKDVDGFRDLIAIGEKRGFFA